MAMEKKVMAFIQLYRHIEQYLCSLLCNVYLMISPMFNEFYQDINRFVSIVLTKNKKSQHNIQAKQFLLLLLLFLQLFLLGCVPVPMILTFQNAIIFLLS